VAVAIQVTMDCADPRVLTDFWADALGYVEQPPPEGFASWPEALAAWGVPESDWNARSAIVDPDERGPRLFFQRVPERKSVKNRVHLDVNVGGGAGTPLEERRVRVAGAVERLTGRGATVVKHFDERDEHWVVMQDPEGNEFCLQ
jgi:hypothetical protein